MLIIELRATSGRITLLGAVDGNRKRRIYKDGLNNPEDPNLTLDGHSIGHREGDAMVIGTTAIVPQALIAISSAFIWPGRMSCTTTWK